MGRTMTVPRQSQGEGHGKDDFSIHFKFAGSLKYSSSLSLGILFLRERVQGSSFFGKGCKDLLASGKGARIFFLRERVQGSSFFGKGCKDLLHWLFLSLTLSFGHIVL